ncbi:MAG: thioredoxin domain-containing protein [Desulfobacterales bacterium]|nr:thioredoxin domain-containing protein [Desulfobacterales bacterium]
MADKIIKPLPFSIYYWSVFSLAAAGLLNMVYSAISHYRVHTDILYVSLCAISDAVNCDTVSQSTYSIFLGVPVPVWGILGYGFFLILLSFAGMRNADNRRIWLLLFIIALFFSTYSLVLAYILKFQIKVYCIVCIAGYGINFMLLYLVWIIRRRFPEKGVFNPLKKDILFLWRPWKKKSAVLLGYLSLFSIILLFSPNYWQFSLPELPAGLASGITEEGDPWIGAEDPEMTIIEYSDYMCFQCRKMHVYLRRIIAENPDKMRLIHRHFPMDKKFNPLLEKSFHPASGKLSIAAAYAALEGKFWKMNDLLYDIPRDIKKLDIRKLSQQSGVSFKGLITAPDNKRVYYKIKLDVLKGIELGVTGTPAYEIDGRLYQGRIPLELINKVNFL